MTRERFAKSREAARQKLKNRNLFSPDPVLNRINTIERAALRSEPAGAIVAQSPFPRKLQTFDDNGELAASEE